SRWKAREATKGADGTRNEMIDKEEINTLFGGATMAIKHTATTTCRSVDGDMTVEEFQGVAEDVRRRQGRAHKPGRASTSHPLLPHGRFSGWKSDRGIRYAEADGDGFIDDLEEFAHKCLGSKIVPY
ncbi:unnamed protein product, partial [Musa acuminata var. zebrina]